MPNLTPTQSLARLPHKQYLSLREVWKDLKLFNTVLAAGPATKKLKLVPDVLDDMTLNELKKAKVNKPTNVKTIPVKKVSPPKTSKKTTIDDEDVPVVKQPKQLSVKDPETDKQVDILDELAPTINGPMFDESNNFIPLETIKLDPKDKASFDAANTQLATLNHQKEIISNIVNSLGHGFANISEESPDNINKAIKYATDIANTVNAKISQIRALLDTSTFAVVPKNFNRLVNNVVNDVKARLNISTKHSVQLFYSSATNNEKSFQLSAFIICKNVQTIHGLTPVFVVAITLLGDDYYINPSLQRMPTIGKFNVGIKLSKNKDGNAIPKEAKRLIDEQLALIGSGHIYNKTIVPPHLEGIELKNIKSVDSVNFTPKSIEVNFNNTVKNGAQAGEAANNIYIILMNSMYVYDPKARIEITPKTGQNADTKQWFAIYVFAKLDSLTGRTLQRDEVDYLSKLFTQEDIKKIRYVLASETGKAA